MFNEDARKGMSAIVDESGPAEIPRDPNESEKILARPDHCRETDPNDVPTVEVGA